eukprot:193495-Amphidinium_carterae.1
MFPAGRGRLSRLSDPGHHWNGPLRGPAWLGWACSPTVLPAPRSLGVPDCAHLPRWHKSWVCPREYRLGPNRCPSCG